MKITMSLLKNHQLLLIKIKINTRLLKFQITHQFNKVILVNRIIKALLFYLKMENFSI